MTRAALDPAQPPKHTHIQGFAIIAENPWDFVGAASLGLAVTFVTFLLVQATSSLFVKVLGRHGGSALKRLGGREER